MTFNRRVLGCSVAAALLSVSAPHAARAQAAETTCPADNGGLSLPKGFCATVFADNVGHARQMAVGPDGTLYVNTWSGVYYNNDTPPPAGFLLALKDTKGTGTADVTARFGETPAQGGKGGTGIWLYKDHVYAEINDRIVRYALKEGELPAADAKGETVLSGMPIAGDHPMHPFAIDADGNLLVSMGSATNSCEAKNRMPRSAGNLPCTELETRAGVWRYDANKLGQTFSPKERYASGIRNGEGFDFDEAGRLFITQHGRDQLHENWPDLYTAEQGWNLPAEEVMILKEGAAYGWPACYFDPDQKKLVQSPEYGGDGKKVGTCADQEPPIAWYPAHWAPNDLKIYKADQFPKAYRGGAFIAFHGSWNRAPGPQGGYNVVFQPLSDGKPSGDYIVFADGFAGEFKDPGRAAHRPSGLAVGPDGALFVSDDQAGRIWRITYQGDPGAAIEPAPAVAAAKDTADAQPPEGVHPDAGKMAALTPPEGSSADQVELGRKVFNGEVAGATCAGCHGADGIGTPVGPNLTTGTWLWGDGSLASLRHTITNGVEEPKQHPGAMPPLGGVELSDENVAAVTAYVWALGHQAK